MFASNLCFFLINLFFFSSVARAQASTGITLQAWLEEWRNDENMEKLAESFASKLLIIRGFDDIKAPEFLKVKPKAYEKFGFFTLVGKRDISWAYTLNQSLFASAEVEKNTVLQDPFSRLFAMSEADVILQSGKQKTLVYANGKGAKEIHEFPSPPKNALRAEKFLKSLLAAINYNAVVCDSKKNHVLVYAPDYLLKDKVQALTLKNSISHKVLTTEQRVGSALMELREKRDGFALFRVITFGKEREALDLGTKVIIQETGAH